VQKKKGGRFPGRPLSLARLSRQLQVPASLPLVRQEFEQHWLFDVQDWLVVRHTHDDSELQAESAQSIFALQLSSLPLPQVSLAAVQSIAHVEQFSLAWQVPLPQQ
jgi:hypothetical protein